MDQVFFTMSLNDLESLIKRCVRETHEEIKSNQPYNSDNSEEILNAKEAASFLNLSTATIYSKVHKGELPYMKRGKLLYFSSTELIKYIKAGRRKTNSELKIEVENHLKKRAESNQAIVEL